ncbi:hypothetical protein Tco_0708929 [Tanacetum coccineum]
MNEVARNFTKERQRVAKPCHEVYITSKIVHYIDVDADSFRIEGFINYFFIRDNGLAYRFTEADYHNLHTQDIDDMYHSSISYLYTQGNDQDIKDLLKIFMRSNVTVVHVEDFQNMSRKRTEKGVALLPLVTPRFEGWGDDCETLGDSNEDSEAAEARMA